MHATSAATVHRVLPVMVLAAGMGSRLRPLTVAMPKALVPVGDRPALQHVLDRIVAARPQRVVVNTHHVAEAIAQFVAKYETVAVSHEPELLGTAGGLARAADLLGDGDVLVWNADILVELEPIALTRAHAAAACDGTLAFRPRARGEGTVGVDATGRLVRLRRERFGAAVDEVQGGDFIGVHVIGTALRKRLPERGCLVGDVYIPALMAGARLQAVACEEPFVDIGSVRSYIDANLSWLSRRGTAHWVGKGTRTARGVLLDRVVVGEGATLAGREGSVIERCVIWPGASALAPLSDAVVIPGAVVRAPHATSTFHS